MNECLNCKSKAKDEAGVCTKRLGSDGLPIMCSGPWILNKHYYLNRYCDIFNNGMKKKWSKRFYIDLFSGPGLSINWANGKEVQGSPLIALSHNFTNFIFAESNKVSLAALKARANKFLRDREVSYFSDDINNEINEITNQLKGEQALFLAFVDPFHIHIKFETLKQLSMNKKVDLLLHFPWGTYLQRVLPVNIKKSTIAKINDYFSDTGWQEILKRERFNAESFLKYYEAKLQTLGYSVDNNLPRMKNSKESTLYYLVFASKHSTGLKFWRETCKIEADGQRKLFYE